MLRFLGALAIGSFVIAIILGIVGLFMFGATLVGLPAPVGLIIFIGLIVVFVVGDFILTMTGN